jgi:hypothetical protein
MKLRYQERTLPPPLKSFDNEGNVLEEEVIVSLSKNQLKRNKKKLTKLRMKEAFALN